MVNVKDMVEAGVFPDEQSAIREALRVLWQEKPHIRIEVAIYRYRAEEISLAKAAALAGVTFDQMKQILDDRGVPLRLGSKTVEEAHHNLSTPPN
jgi:predicted HTH domain antitoxin